MAKEKGVHGTKGLEPSVGSKKQNPLILKLKVPQGQASAIRLPSSLPQPLHPSHTGQLSISPFDPRTFACAILANGVPLPMASTF